MRDDEIRQWLRDRNPWWRAGAAENRMAWTRNDPSLSQAQQYEVGYHPPVFDHISPGDLVVLRGPRRVGKSVALKRYAVTLLSRADRSPFEVLYVPADDLSAADLRRVLRIARELTRIAGEAPRYWLFDEITAVDGWPRIIKEARDNSQFAHDAVVLTGSSAADLTAARSALGAGRAGGGTDRFRLLLPMTFRDFLSATGREIPPVPVVDPDQLQSDEFQAALRVSEPFVNELDLAWQDYCESGGFPRAVAEWKRDGEVSDGFSHDLVSWLGPDVAPDEPVDSTMALLAALAQATATPVNVTQLGVRLGTPRERMRGRISRLVKSFGAIECPQLNSDGLPVPSSQSKIYLMDPLLERIPHLLDPVFPVPDMSRQTEAALATHLARSIDRVQPGRLVDGRAVGYRRTGSGNEIDFAPQPIRSASGIRVTVAIESKWVSRQWRREALVMENSVGSGIMATKSILDVDNYRTWAVPAPIVALSLSISLNDV